MNESNKDDNINKEDNSDTSKKEKNAKNSETTIEEKLKISEEKLLRSLADSENQRRRFEKEIKDAFDFGGFNFAREMLTLLDNLQRAKKSIQEDDVLKKSKEFKKFFSNIEIIEKDLISIFEKNKIDPKKKIAFTCGSGITACVLGLTYSIIGGNKPVIYDGSWAEYGIK